MVENVKMAKEISILMANKVGLLAEICKLIADKGINIEAAAGYGKGKEAEIMLITDKNTAAIETLVKNNYKAAKERDVIVLEMKNKPGALKDMTRKLADKGIDIKHLYGTTPSGDCPAKIVLNTSDNQKALVALK